MNVSELWKNHNTEIIRYLIKSTNSVETAEDIAPEVFLKALMHEEIFHEMTYGQCRSWLYTTAKNKAIDYFRRKKGHQQLQSDDLTTEDDMSWIWVSDLIAKLPEDLEELFLMRYYADMDSSVIGNILGIPPPTVRTRLRKACSLLRKYYNMDKEK